MRGETDRYLVPVSDTLSGLIAATKCVHIHLCGENIYTPSKHATHRQFSPTRSLVFSHFGYNNGVPVFKSQSGTNMSIAMIAAPY